MNPKGRPLDRRRERYMRQFDITHVVRPDHKLTVAVMDQLDACKGNEARRVLLGIGRKKEPQ